MENKLLKLLEEKPDFAADKINKLISWEHFPVFMECFQTLNKEALYKSHIHGIHHIERVLFLSAVNACDLNLSAQDSRLCFLAASYHDTGRIDDSVDDAHGRRSAMKLPDLVSVTDEEMAILQAAITVHSMDDRNFANILSEYNVKDRERGLLIIKMLKDADNLDRVRVGLLDPSYLRLPNSKTLVSFAMDLYRYYGKE